MESKKRVIYDEKQLLDHFLQKTLESMFEIPTKGKNGFNTNKVTLENELNKHITTKITTQDREFLFSEMNKINARIQDLSVVGKKNLTILC